MDRCFKLEQRRHFKVRLACTRRPWRTAQTEEAARFAANIRPIVEAIRATGVTTFTGIAEEFNVRGRSLRSRRQMVHLKRRKPDGEMLKPILGREEQESMLGTSISHGKRERLAQAPDILVLEFFRASRVAQDRTAILSGGELETQKVITETGDSII